MYIKEESIYEYNYNINETDENVFRNIFENNPQAIAVINPYGYFIETNHKWQQLFGYSRNELNGLHIIEMIHTDDYHVLIKTIRLLFKKNFNSGRFEVFLLKKNGTKLWVDISAVIIKDYMTETINSIALYVDSGNKNPVEKTHRSSEIKSHILLEESPIGIVVYRKRRLLFANMAYAKIFGFDKPEDMIGMTGFKLVAENERKLVIKRNISLEEGSIDTDIYETVCHKKNGTDFNVSVNTVRIILGEEPSTLGFLQDITDRKQIEEDLKRSYDVLEERVLERTKEIINLNQLMINSQEQERQRIAKDLHDGVGQSILAAKVNISLFKNDSVLYPDRLERGLLLLDQSVKELREICSDLFPSVLDEFGLASAIRLYAKYSLGSSGISVELDLCNDLKTKKETEINLYRIVQESFSNILKHSGADRVKITLENQNDRVKLSIEDNGIGFNPYQIIKSRNHCGLISMKQRAEGLGGIILIDTSVNKGTTLKVILP